MQHREKRLRLRDELELTTLTCSILDLECFRCSKNLRLVGRIDESDDISLSTGLAEAPRRGPDRKG